MEAVHHGGDAGAAKAHHLEETPRTTPIGHNVKCVVSLVMKHFVATIVLTTLIRTRRLHVLLLLLSIGYNIDHNWYADTGATDHLTSDLDRLTMHECYKGSNKFQVANGSGMAISQTIYLSRYLSYGFLSLYTSTKRCR